MSKLGSFLTGAALAAGGSYLSDLNKRRKADPGGAAGLAKQANADDAARAKDSDEVTAALGGAEPFADGGMVGPHGDRRYGKKG